MTAQKKPSFDFAAGCTRMLKVMGAVDGPRGSLALPTVAGDLMCRPCEDWLACQFVQPSRAVDHFKDHFTDHWLNPHTGKWNWHYTNPTQADLELLHFELSRVALTSARSDEIIKAYVEADRQLGPWHADTVLTYRHTDASGAAETREIAFRGTVNGWTAANGHLQALLGLLDHRQGLPSFMPAQLGLPDLQGNDGDSPWHELVSLTPVIRGEGGHYDGRDFTALIQGLRTLVLEGPGWDESCRAEAPVRDRLRETAR